MSDGRSWHPHERPVRVGRRIGRSEVTVPDGRRLHLNDTALAVWEAADGETTVAELTSALAILAGMADADAATAIATALAELERAGLVDHAGRTDRIR